MNQSLDGYVDHLNFLPSPALFRHFIEQTRGSAGSVYGRCMYEIMRYWDEELVDWDAEERDLAAAWRLQPKWVVSHSLKSVGPNATLIEDDMKAVVRGLKARLDGEIEVGGPTLAKSLGDLGLIDEYRLYLHPVVVGHGKPFFAGPRPRLRLASSERIAEDVMKLIYVPTLSRGLLHGHRRNGDCVRSTPVSDKLFRASPQSFLGYCMAPWAHCIGGLRASSTIP